MHVISINLHTLTFQCCLCIVTTNVCIQLLLHACHQQSALICIHYRFQCCPCVVITDSCYIMHVININLHTLTFPVLSVYSHHRRLHTVTASDIPVSVWVSVTGISLVTAYCVAATCVYITDHSICSVNTA